MYKNSLFLAVVLVFAPLSALASTPTAPPTCVTLTQNLAAGATDAATGGAVSKLQSFLAAQGSAIYPEGLVTGVFGPATARALGRLQVVRGVAGITSAGATGYGFAGPKTRAALACGAAPITVTLNVNGIAVDASTLVSSSRHPLLTGTATIPKIGIIIVNSAGVGISGSFSIPVKAGHWSYTPAISLTPGTYTLQLINGTNIATAAMTITQ